MAHRPAEQAKKDTTTTTQIVVPGGTLKIREGDPFDKKSTIHYNDNLVHEFDGVYIGLHSFVFLDFGSEAVLIYYTNAGGSGTSNAYGIVAIGREGRIYETNLPVGTGKFAYEVTQERISFELGLQDGKEVRAIFANGRLDVSRKAAPKAGLKAQDCDFLYNDVLTECSDAGQTVCRYDDMQISMARQRPVNMMATDDPNFRRQDFEATCEQACRVKKKPAYAAFRKAVCQAR